MEPEINNNYLESVGKLFRYYKTLAEQAIEQLDPEKLFYCFNEDSNSIALIVQHLHGNMLSRWTDFLSSDGEKPWRNRDSEFENGIKNKTELLQKWNEGWDRFLATLDSLKAPDLNRIIYIRNEGHTVMEAINRQLAHYPYHIGQIIYAAKILKQKDWKSLSIPKNKSKEFNQDKFLKEKQRKHFTDEK
jgi:hypothetical protein